MHVVANIISCFGRLVKKLFLTCITIAGCTIDALRGSDTCCRWLSISSTNTPSHVFACSYENNLGYDKKSMSEIVCFVDLLPNLRQYSEAPLITIIFLFTQVNSVVSRPYKNNELLFPVFSPSQYDSGFGSGLKQHGGCKFTSSE